MTNGMKVVQTMLRSAGFDPGPIDGVWGERTLRALQTALGTEPKPEAPVGGMRTSDRGVALIHSFEQCRLQAYPDPGSADGRPVTIGWGSTTDEKGRPIFLGTTWTQERADARFRQDLTRFERSVNALVLGVPTTQAQFDALVSFAYNVGVEALGKSTLLRKHRAGDYAGARAEFARWNKNDGRVMNGLVRRRAAEAELYAS